MAHGPGRPVGLAAAAVLACIWPQAQAQIYSFQDVAVLPRHSLRPLYAFYVYSKEEAPSPNPGDPYVQFQVTAHSESSSSTDASLANYGSLQMTLVPYAHFLEYIHPTRFCSSAADVQQGLAEKPEQLLVRKPVGKSLTDLNVYPFTVPFGTGHRRKAFSVLHATAAYILTASNCGNFSDATISGNVVVRNPYGFVPGHEYRKMMFYPGLGVCYLFMSLVWFGLMVRWRDMLFRIHYCIFAVILMGMAESGVWYIFYADWNSRGLRKDYLFAVGIGSTVVKSAFSYMLVLVASLGWGITRAHLDRSSNIKVTLVAFFYIVLDMIRESVLSFRHSYTLSLSFVLLCVLPVAILNASIFFWIFSALSSLMQTLRDRKQTAKLQLFGQLWQVIVAALSVATLTLMFQIIDLSRSISIRWHYQWFLDVGVPHILFLGVLTAMMYLWAPSANSQAYTYSEQLAGDDDVEEGNRSVSKKVPEKMDYRDEEDGDDANFWDEPVRVLALEDGQLALEDRERKARERERAPANERGSVQKSPHPEKIGAGSDCD